MSKGNNGSKIKFVLEQGSSPKRWRSESPLKEFGGSYLWLGHTAAGKMGDYFVRRGNESDPMDGENGHVTLLFRAPKATKEKDYYYSHSKFDMGGKSLLFFKNEDGSLTMMFKENTLKKGGTSGGKPSASPAGRGGYGGGRSGGYGRRA